MNEALRINPVMARHENRPGLRSSFSKSPSLLAQGTAQAGAFALAHLPLMAMRFTRSLAVGVLGSVTVRTPFLKEAVTFPSSISSTGNPALELPIKAFAEAPVLILGLTLLLARDGEDTVGKLNIKILVLETGQFGRDLDVFIRFTHLDVRPPGRTIQEAISCPEGREIEAAEDVIK